MNSHEFHVHRLQALFDDGRFQSISDLSRQLDLDQSYVARTLKLTLLAPDITLVIIDGREPSGLLFNVITRILPVDWEGRRKALGVRND